jgi:GntR family transcriptional regulator
MRDARYEILEPPDHPRENRDRDPMILVHPASSIQHPASSSIRHRVSRVDSRSGLDRRSLVMYCITSVTQLSLHRFLEVDTASAVPIWRQIEDGMRRLVASKRLAPGSVVPSVRELAKALRVNPATVSKAYRRLTESGLLTVRRGEGTFVGELEPEELEEQRRLLLIDGATSYVRVAASMGASRDEATRAVRERWDSARDENGEGVTDGG